MVIVLLHSSVLLYRRSVTNRTRKSAEVIGSQSSSGGIRAREEGGVCEKDEDRRSVSDRALVFATRMEIVACHQLWLCKPDTLELLVAGIHNAKSWRLE